MRILNGMYSGLIDVNIVVPGDDSLNDLAGVVKISSVAYTRATLEVRSIYGFRQTGDIEETRDMTTLMTGNPIMSDGKDLIIDEPVADFAERLEKHHGVSIIRGKVLCFRYEEFIDKKGMISTRPKDLWLKGGIVMRYVRMISQYNDSDKFDQINIHTGYDLTPAVYRMLKHYDDAREEWARYQMKDEE